MKKLPRSGAWMVWVRTIFGFILIAMAVYFLKSLFPNPLFYSLAHGPDLARRRNLHGLDRADENTAAKLFLYVRSSPASCSSSSPFYAAATGIQGYLDEKINAKLQSLRPKAEA